MDSGGCGTLHLRYCCFSGTPRSAGGVLCQRWLLDHQRYCFVSRAQSSAVLFGQRYCVVSGTVLSAVPCICGTIASHQRYACVSVCQRYTRLSSGTPDYAAVQLEQRYKLPLARVVSHLLALPRLSLDDSHRRIAATVLWNCTCCTPLCSMNSARRQVAAALVMAGCLPSHLVIYTIRKQAIKSVGRGQGSLASAASGRLPGPLHPVGVLADLDGRLLCLEQSAITNEAK